MRRLFQDFAEGDYDRPSQRWVCGLADEACACPFGPTPKGRCPEQAECQPVKLGDRWRCNRPATRGGPCDTNLAEGESGGPSHDGVCCRVNKCRPRLSLRARRGRWVLGGALLVAGMLALAVGSPWRSEALSPGPLTRQHAQLLAHDGDPNRCSACHAGQGQSTLTLAIGNLGGHHEGQATQSGLCMNCHQNDIDPAAALLAHSLPAAVLETSYGKQIACSACHQEHHGASYNLTHLSNARCQACHEQRYNSFAGNHPEFGVWPYKRRTRIAFDHVSHLKKHFVEEKRAFDCAQCHVEGPGGKTMLTTSYTTACGECHDQGIHTSAGAGLAIVSLPSLDLEALAEQGVPLDAWPALATGDFDGDVPAPLKLLQADDPALGALLDRYGPGFSFFDIDPDSAADARDAKALVESIRGLLRSLRDKGQPELLVRLEKAAGRTFTADEATALTAGLPVDLVDRAIERWFAGDGPTEGATPIEQAAKQPAGGWFLSDATLSLNYAPTGHADPLLKSWIDLIISLDDSKRAIRESALADLASPKSPGQCLTCHSVERSPGGKLLVNWRPLDPLARPRGFTQFNHGPHVVVNQLASCSACHQFDESADSTAAYASLDPHKFVSHFHPLTKAACAECHVPSVAGDSCSQCHNYHVGAAPAGFE